MSPKAPKPGYRALWSWQLTWPGKLVIDERLVPGVGHTWRGRGGREQGRARRRAEDAPRIPGSRTWWKCPSAHRRCCTWTLRRCSWRCTRYSPKSRRPPRVWLVFSAWGGEIQRDKGVRPEPDTAIGWGEGVGGEKGRGRRRRSGGKREVGAAS